MHKSLFAVTLCMAFAAASQVSMAADDSTKPVEQIEVKPTIASGNADDGKAAAATCAACHGADGVSATGEFPNLAGQGAPYTYKQLTEFKSGARVNPVMLGMVAPLSDQDMHNLAAYYAELPAPQESAQDVNLELGRQIFQGGITSIGVPACMSCHAPDGAGNDAAKFPRLGGQKAAYVASALKNFRSGNRANDPGKMMRMVAERLSDAEIEAVANYVQGLH